MDILKWWKEVDADYLTSVGGGEPEFVKKAKEINLIVWKSK